MHELRNLVAVSTNLLDPSYRSNRGQLIRPECPATPIALVAISRVGIMVDACPLFGEVIVEFGHF